MEPENKREVDEQVIPLAYHEMCMIRNARKFRDVIISATIIILFVIGLAAYERLQYDYTDSTECEGFYNLVDSEGNVISSDLTTEDIIRIAEAMENGENQNDTQPDTQ